MPKYAKLDGHKVSETITKQSKIYQSKEEAFKDGKEIVIDVEK